MNERRRTLARRYRDRLAGLPITLPQEAPGATHVYHLFVIRTRERDALRTWLKEREIQTGIHYPVPCHKQLAVIELNPPDLPRTETIVGEILTLPLSPDHADAEIDEVAEAVRAYFHR
jgi:dTDP-4-amino-4,6-dideoxygalactose transaminase